ncbi:MAG TPA: hypothetical protein VGA56_12970 [Opitutaceae bacterium]
MRKLAKRLIAHDARENKSSETISPTTFPVPEKLRPLLAALVGNAGFRALLSRALVLARPEVPWLRAAHVKADGSLTGPAKFEAQIDPETIVAGRIAVLAQLLELLRDFIGGHLTMQLIREAWPALFLKVSSFANGDGNESET